MEFSWPALLLLLLVIPAAVAGYWWVLRRRRRRAVPYSSVALIRAAAPRRAGWRRHAPFALLLAALACLTTAAARPQVKLEVPSSGSAVILALDVSGSMCSTDVDPNRLTAAQNAVRQFVKAQDGSTRIGLVVFSGFAQLTVAPTTQRDDLYSAIDALTVGRGTTIGAAILKSVDAIAQIDSNVRPADPGGAASPGSASGAAPGDAAPAPGGGSAASPAPVAPKAGSVPYAPEIVVLLTDGANTSGITPLDAAAIAAQRGVRVFPIGFGTTNPAPLVCTADQLGGQSFGGPRFGGGIGGTARRNFLVADDDTLKAVASTTGGTFFSASDAGQLNRVLADLPRHVQVTQQDVEVSAELAGLAVVLLLLAGWAAVRWSTFPA